MFHKIKQKEKILVVDDEPDIIMFISKYLEHNDYDVITAINGEEALKKAAGEKPDLILLDARMPVIDGWETLERLRKHPDFNNTPVIMVTALCEAKDIAAASAYGVVDYITKPFDPVVLIEKISHVLQPKR